MKAWRKHNQKQTATIRNAQENLQYWNSAEEHARLHKQIKLAEGLKLRTKQERRTHYSAEVAVPSYILLALFKRVGLWTPA